MRFEGKKVVVTGAASGIGEAIALGFAKEGASVAFMDLNKEIAEKCAFSAKETYKTNCIGIGVDVSDKKSVTEALDIVTKLWWN